MSWKKILALALLLAVLIVAIVYVDRRAKGKPAVEGTLIDMPAASVEKIELRNKNGRFVFALRDMQWYLVEPLAAKADKVALESILDNFCELKYDRLVAENARELEGFGLDSPEIELKLFAKGMNQPEASVMLGAKNGLDDSSYAMLAAGGKVVSIAAYKRIDLEKGLFAFRDKKFLEIDASAVSALGYRVGDKALAFTKKNEQWLMDTPVYSLAQDAKVNDILTAASTLEALSFAAAPDAAARRGFGLEKPLLTAEFRSAGSFRRITVGQKGERFFAWVEGTSEICEIAKDLPDKFSGDAALFREKKVARFYAFDVRELAFQRGLFNFSVRKNAAGAWEFAKPAAGRKPSAEKIERLLSALADCEAGGFIDGPRGLPGFTARADLKVEDPADPEKLGPVTMEFSEAEGESVIARNPALPYDFKVGKEILRKLPGRIDDIAEDATGAAGAGK
ncbi:MAG TPA: DUF4340 domain-containing protein [Acidobacteriota bacterium]